MPRKSVNILDRYSDVPLDSPERRTIQNRNAQRVYRARKAKRMIPALPDGEECNLSRSSSMSSTRRPDKRPQQSRANSFEFIMWSPNDNVPDCQITTPMTKSSSTNQGCGNTLLDEDLFAGLFFDGLDTAMQMATPPMTSIQSIYGASRHNTSLSFIDEQLSDSLFAKTTTMAPFDPAFNFEPRENDTCSSQPSPPTWSSDQSSGLSSFSDHFEAFSGTKSMPVLGNVTAKLSDTPDSIGSSEQEASNWRLSEFTAPKNRLRHSLHTAAECNRVQVIRLLLDTGCDVNVRNGSCQTPLHIAAAEGHDEAIQILCEYGGNINAFDSQGKTAVHLATRNGHAACVQLLLNLGADMWAHDDGTMMTD